MSSMVYSAIMLATVILPTVIALGALFGYRKWHDRDGRSSPISNRPVHGPGEQLRKRIDDDTTELMASYSVIPAVGPMLLAVWALSKLDWSAISFRPFDLFYVLLFIAATTFAILRMIRYWKRIRRCTDGRKAELYTAQELNRLIGEGCTVLHDVPGEGFNLDHVVIGPDAVYVVETKAVRKPRKDRHRDGHKVTYDGSKLHFPGYSTSKPVEQAKRQADWLRRYLKETISLDIRVKATLALPGWWIDAPKEKLAVRAFNPAGKGAQFMAQAESVRVDAHTTALVRQALVMRFPVNGAK